MQLDTQVVELLGRQRLIAELLRDGLERAETLADLIQQLPPGARASRKCRRLVQHLAAAAA